MKLIQISCCGNCPYIKKNLDSELFTCDVGQYTIIEDATSILPTCQLKDAPKEYIKQVETEYILSTTFTGMNIHRKDFEDERVSSESN